METIEIEEKVRTIQESHFIEIKYRRESNKEERATENRKTE
jgi:hypothetical protein